MKKNKVLVNSQAEEFISALATIERVGRDLLNTKSLDDLFFTQIQCIAEFLSNDLICPHCDKQLKTIITENGTKLLNNNLIK
jgi:hypothetical protein